MITNQGQIQSLNDLTLTSDELTNSGDISSLNQATLTQTSTLTSSGNIHADGDATVEAKTLTLETESELIGGNVTLNADTLVQDGVVNAEQTLNVTATTVEIRGDIGSEHDTTFNVDYLTQTANSTVNTNGNLTLTDAHTLTQSGEINAKSSITLEAEQITIGGALNAEHDVTVEADRLALSSQVIANRDINITTQSDLNAQKDLIAGRNLTLSAGSLDNNAEITSTGTTQINVSGTLTNQQDAVISGFNTELTSNTAFNYGVLQALADLQLNAADTTNYGALIALNNAQTNLTGTLTNRGVIYAGNNGYLYANTLSNYSDVLTLNDLTIAKNAELEKSVNLYNSSGRLESIGNVSIYTKVLTNSRTDLSIEADMSNDISSEYPLIYDANNTTHMSTKVERQCPSYAPCEDVEVYDPSTAKHRPTLQRVCGPLGVCVYAVLDGATFTVPVLTESEYLQSASSPAYLVATNELTIMAEEVENNASHIAGKEVVVDAKHLANIGYDLSDTSVYYDYEIRGNDHPEGMTHPDVDGVFYKTLCDWGAVLLQVLATMNLYLIEWVYAWLITDREANLTLLSPLRVT
ncbi:hypothetical protein [Vibrio sonorensis]|uniref:hypothetical protein n=1 Tax=Vibrio sonorensis TaxID=1004316 RepID=UPI0008D91E6C|nr:hypothetical protein [Vibrio sonorensis]